MDSTWEIMRDWFYAGLELENMTDTIIDAQNDIDSDRD